MCMDCINVFSLGCIPCGCRKKINDPVLFYIAVNLGAAPASEIGARCDRIFTTEEIVAAQKKLKKNFSVEMDRRARGAEEKLVVPLLDVIHDRFVFKTTAAHARRFDMEMAEANVPDFDPTPLLIPTPATPPKAKENAKSKSA